MKPIKFAANLVPKILDSSKTATWRLFDDKDLQVGDHLEFINAETGETFAKAEVSCVQEKKLGDITESDFAGHETYTSRNEMLETYQGYYGDRVNWDTVVKMVDFDLVH